MDFSFIRDPTTSKARVYVGGLSENVSKKDMEEYFQKYGALIGVVVNRGFGFIQFESEESAQAAIKDKHGQMGGKKIFVKAALNSENRPQRSGAPSGGGGIGGGVGGSGGSSGVSGTGTGVGGNITNKGASTATIWNSGSSQIDNFQDRTQSSSSWNSFNRSDRDRSPIDDRDRRIEFPQQINYPTANLGNIPLSNMGAMSNLPSMSYGSPLNPDRNDCEIIVVSKALTAYAESIEAQLKRLGLSVDLLFPNEDVPIGKVLGNISSRGCLYAVLVTPQNEEHRSITVNVLYGQPAEHRNMPVDYAINFIAENFNEKLKQDKGTLPGHISITPASATAPPLKERHPEAIQILLNLLADNRMLTVLQYDKIIKYLTERKEFQIKAELGEDEVQSAAKAAVTKQLSAEQELQQKILNILNKPSITSNIPDVVRPEPQQESTQLLHDPKVQKALDSLLQGSLLSALGSGFKF